MIFQDGRIDYNEFVAMMQKGDNDMGKRRLQSNFSMGFREALPVYWHSDGTESLHILYSFKFTRIH